MKLLLDENLPVKLKHFFSGKHDINTVSEKGWAGKKNGELLGLMTLNGFDGLITIDKNLVHQQNIGRFDVTIFVLNAANNKIETLKPFIEKLESYSQPNDENIIQVSIDDENI
jgi:predicted nuclease of predicted toxin-antitoxin system